MMKNISIQLLLLFVSAFGPSLQAQSIWPGDVNNNGVVNGADLLFLGLAFGAEGPARPGATTDFVPQDPGPPWSQDFPNGLNYAFADANGDGVVDDDDLEDGIEDNFGQRQGGAITPDGYARATAGQGPRIRLRPDQEIVGEGATVNIDLILGESDFPVSNFYGMALKMSYDPELLENDEELEYDELESSWIAADDSQLEDLFIPNGATGRAEWAVTRNDQNTVGPGAGKIGSFSIVVEDIIVGLRIDTFRLQIDSVLLIDQDLRVHPVVPDTAEIIIAKDPDTVTSTAQPVATRPRLLVYPNPVTNRRFTLKSEPPLRDWGLFNAVGQPVGLRLQARNGNRYQFSIPARLPKGVYYLRAYANHLTFYQKIIIHDY